MESFAWDARAALVSLGQHLHQQRYAFTCVTPATHARVLARTGDQARDLAGAFGWNRPFPRELLPLALSATLQQAGIVAPFEGRLRSRVRVASLDGDLFFHSAFPTDAPDSVFFGPDTYRFARAVRALLSRRTAAVRRAVEACCGAGPGAVAIARSHPEASVWALDINEAALCAAEASCALAGLEQIEVRQADLLQGAGEDLDLVVANPPYLVDRGRRVYRHGGGVWGAALSEALVHQALPRLAVGGTLLLYTGVAIRGGVDPFREWVFANIPNSMQASYQEVDPDVFGEELSRPPYTEADRIAAVLLTVHRIR